MKLPVTRLVFAVAAHLHMTAGEVRTRMDSHELMCWSWILTRTGDEPREMSVDEEMAAWG
jgi:hypothetical protein